MGECVVHIKPPVRVERRRMVGRVRMRKTAHTHTHTHAHTYLLLLTHLVGCLMNYFFQS